jgi:hypothetical protein
MRALVAVGGVRMAERMRGRDGEEVVWSDGWSEVTRR